MMDTCTCTFSVNIAPTRCPRHFADKYWDATVVSAMTPAVSTCKHTSPFSWFAAQPLASQLVFVAACVRTAYLALIVLSGYLIKDYDTSASLLSESCSDNWPEAAARAQQYWPGVVWDSVFLHRIAACGYEYEQFFAFFPGLPGLQPGPWGFSIAVLVLNNACFLLSVWLLARLSQKLLQDDCVTATAVLVFIASPASIHHSMLYTEALFTATSWLGLYCLYCQGSSLTASLAFAASSAIRSNGLLNAGFLMHQHGRRVLAALQKGEWAYAVIQAATGVLCAAFAVAPYFAYMAFGYQVFCTGAHGGNGPYKPRPWCSKALPSAYGFVQDVYWNVGFLRYYELSQIPNFLIAAPTLVMSLWGVLAYAAANPHLLLTGGLLPAQQLQTWFCNSSSSKSSCRDGSSKKEGQQVTSCMWLPCVIVGQRTYCSHQDRPDDVCNVTDGASAAAVATSAERQAIPGVAHQRLRLRLQETPQVQQPGQQQAAAPEAGPARSSNNSYGSSSRGQSIAATQPTAHTSSSSSDGHEQPEPQCSCASNRSYYSPGAAVFVIHWAFLTLVCLAVVHIQVSTRFLSSCIPLYWFAALLMLHQGAVLRWLLWWYCFAFMGVGAVMFTNFLPWT